MNGGINSSSIFWENNTYVWRVYSTGTSYVPFISHWETKTDFTLQNEQIQDIEQTKLSSKKRQGVAHFVKYFPTYVASVENQLIGADDLEIRTSVDAAYEKIVQTIFDSLKQMAKMDGEGEDKGQLNYHVILIGVFVKTSRSRILT